MKVFEGGKILKGIQSMYVNSLYCVKGESCLELKVMYDKGVYRREILSNFHSFSSPCGSLYGTDVRKYTTPNPHPIEN